MCWISNSLPYVQIAEKDIPVFKILRRDLVSAYFNFPYNIGETYKIREINVHYWDIFEDEYVIRAGFHSYDPSLVIAVSDTYILKVLLISRGYRLDHFNAISFKIVDCIIPEGSKYYKNEYGEIVSDCIKICKVRE